MNTDNQILFSIIIVTMNSGTRLNDTVHSVLQQNYKEFEIVIKDANSTDGSCMNLPDDDRIVLITKSDTGIYDAMNQAIKYAKGEYLLFLNSGDLLYNESVLKNVCDKLMIQEEPVIAYGNVYHIGKNKVINYPSTVNSMFFYSSTFCHQATFFPTNIDKTLLTYDTSYRIAADRKVMLALIKNNIKCLYLDMIVCSYEGGGISESEQGIQLLKNEKKKLRKECFDLAERFLCCVDRIKSLIFNS